MKPGLLRLLGISPNKRPPGLVYHQRAQSNEFSLRAATMANFFHLCAAADAA
jgi:hypothetical protein